MIQPLGTREHRRSSWASRLLLTALLCAAAGSAYGVLRGNIGALPGIAGMFFGGIAGYVTCKTAGADTLDRVSFSSRVWLAFSGAIVYAFAALLVTGSALSSPADSPFYWIERIAGGYFAEPFFTLGRSGAVLRSYSGSLRGGWWNVFTILDTALFAFLFLAGYACGFDSKRRKATQRESAEKQDQDVAPRARSTKLPAFSFFFVLALLAGVFSIGRIAFEEYRLSSAILSEYAGKWTVRESDSIAFSSEEERTFKIQPGVLGDLYGESVKKNFFSFSLHSKGFFAGRFSGTFNSSALPFSFSHVRAVFLSPDELLVVFSGLEDGNRLFRAVRSE